MTEENAYATPVNFNFMPAKIKGPDGNLLYDKGRAVGVDTIGDVPGGFYFYGVPVAGSGRAVQTLIAIEAPTSVVTVGDNHWQITSSKTGLVYDVYRGSGCGCGSPVKKMSLPPLRYLNVSDHETVQF